MLSARAQIKDIINKTLSYNAIEETFSATQTTDIVTLQFESCYNELSKFFNSLNSQTNSQQHENQDNMEIQLKKEAIQELVNQMYQLTHVKKQLMVLRLITKLVNSRVIDVRLACEYMLNNLVYNSPSTSKNENKFNSVGSSNNNVSHNVSIVQKMNQSNQNGNLPTTPPYLWLKILECVQKFIPLHDYKSCRDIFKMLLEVVKRLPHSSSSYPPQLEADTLLKSPNKRLIDYSENDYEINSADVQSGMATDDIKLESLYETINYLLDRNNYFMPRYLAINEIKTVLTFGKEPYHQRFHKLFTKFVESFIPIAHLISVSGRDKLLPVVGFSNLYSLSSVWRFNPSTCKFNISGPLPYYKHVSRPHHELYFYLLRQNTPQYLLLSLMSMNRSTKTRLQAFEEEYAKSIVDTMRLTERNSSNNLENLRIWNNLVNQLVVLSHIIHIPAFIHQLLAELKKTSESFQVSRDWLMWFLLMIIPTNINRNILSEFSDIYEVLFKEDEVLPLPDLSSFESVIKFSALSIWIHFNMKLINQSEQSANQSSNKSKSSNIPELLKNQYNLLQEIMANQNIKDFGISICLNTYSTDQSYLNKPLSVITELIGRSSLHQNINDMQSNLDTSNTIFTNHQPLSIEMICSFTLHVRMHLASYLSNLLTQKANAKVMITNIPASIIETFTRLVIFDPDNFIKYFTQNVWLCLTTLPLNQFAVPPIQQQQSIQPAVIQTTFLNQQINLLIEIICFRLKRLSFTHRTHFLLLLNSLFTSNQANQMSNSNQQQPNQQINFIKHPQIYINIQCAMLKLLSSFSGSDYIELLNSIYIPQSSSTSKNAPKNFINPDSEEINKAIVLVIAKAIHLTSSDLQPMENKDKDDSLRNLLREIMKTTPIYFHQQVIDYFPPVIKEFFEKEQQPKPETIYADSSNKNYQFILKQKVDADYKKFLDCKHESQAQAIFQNSQPPHNFFCVFFKLLQDNSVQSMFNNYLSYILFYLNSCENKKVVQSLRTFCDYLIVELNSKEDYEFQNYASQIINMITVYNVFTYDRFLLIMTFRSFSASDFKVALKLLNKVFVLNQDFQNKYCDFINLWNANCNGDEEWNISFYSQYIRQHPEKFFYEGIREKLGLATNDIQINTYYGNMIMRCVPVLDFLNSRYIELNYQSNESDALLDTLNSLFKFHHNPISYVYNSLVYYNSKFEKYNARDPNQMDSDDFDNASNLKKRRLLNIITEPNQRCNLLSFSPIFQEHFQKVEDSNQMNMAITPDITPNINTHYFYILIQRFVKRMLDQDFSIEFNSFKSEYQNPSCHLFYITLCELLCLELFAKHPKTLASNIGSDIIKMFFTVRFDDSPYAIDKDEFVYWTNVAGIIIGNMPETYWRSIYEILAETMKTDELLNQTEFSESNIDSSSLLDHFDLYIADAKNCFNKVTLIITIFHSIWTHSNTNHFQYFVKFIKDRREELVRTEFHFLFLCKLIGPFLSKIHLENTNLLIDLAQELYEMMHRVDKLNQHQDIYYQETICNFFYHLKYRHIGESIKEKIHSLMPDFRPELKTQFKYITSELNQQLQMQQQQLMKLNPPSNSPPNLKQSGSFPKI